MLDALRKEGFDWEQERRAMFNKIGPYMRATWCRPTPGTPLNSYDDGLEWPEELPMLDESRNEKEKRDVEMAFGNFALLLIEPFEVDYVELGTKPDRRTMYRREPEQVKFVETIVVP